MTAFAPNSNYKQYYGLKWTGSILCWSQ